MEHQGLASVVWTQAQDFGIKFDFEIPDPVEMSYGECLGVGYFSGLIRFQKAHHKKPKPGLE